MTKSQFFEQCPSKLPRIAFNLDISHLNCLIRWRVNFITFICCNDFDSCCISCFIWGKGYSLHSQIVNNDDGDGVVSLLISRSVWHCALHAHKAKLIGPFHWWRHITPDAGIENHSMRLVLVVLSYVYTYVISMPVCCSAMPTLFVLWFQGTLLLDLFIE